MKYTLIRSSRRTLSIQIDRDGFLIVRAPMRLSISMIEDWLDKKHDWIQKHQERQSHAQPKRHFSPEEKQSMKQELANSIIPRVERLWKLATLPAYTGIKITLSEKRWGSCSGKNGLCFSYRLAEYLHDPVGNRFIDAVIIHELAHLQEKNHQKSFWNLVYQMMPDYDICIKLHEGSPE